MKRGDEEAAVGFVNIGPIGVMAPGHACAQRWDNIPAGTFLGNGIIGVVASGGG